MTEPATDSPTHTIPSAEAIKTEPLTPSSVGRTTAPSKLAAQLATMQAAARKQRMPSLEQRLAHLEKLEHAVIARKKQLIEAMSADWGHRSAHEAMSADIFTVVKATKHARANLAEWMEPEERDVDATFFPARAEILYQPLGVVGIIAPWNYPVQLALSPLVDALAAGNRAILKPSEFVPQTAAALAELIAATFEPDHVTVVQGGPDVAAEFSALPFDHLFFTGSTRVGRIVMKAAAEHLTPVTLELGGKSPAILGQGYPVASFAASVVGGKLFNAGQTCIAPDYVLVPKGQGQAFVDAFSAAVKKSYGTLIANPDYSAIANAPHRKRLRGLLDDAKARGATITIVNPGNESDETSPKLLPALIQNAPEDCALMQDEIFGPLLPVIEVDDLQAAIDYVNARPHPLALYYFDRNSRRVDKVLAETIAGGVTINDTLFHQVQESLPFGGVGPSGLGHYHGREGFITLSKKKPVFHQSRFNGANLIRPPYGKAIELAMRLLVGK